MNHRLRHTMRSLLRHSAWLRICILGILLLGSQILLLAPRGASAQAAATSVRMNTTQKSRPTKQHQTTVHAPAGGNAPGIDATISNTAPNTSYTIGDTVPYQLVVSTTAGSTPIGSSAVMTFNTPINVSDPLPLGLTNIVVNGGTTWTVNASTTTSPSIITATYIGTYPVEPSTSLPAITITATLANTASDPYTTTATVAVDGDTNPTNDTSTYSFTVVTPPTPTATPIPTATPTPTPTATPIPTATPTPTATPVPTFTAPSITPNLALDGPAIASSVIPGSTAANAVDGNPVTSWSSGGSNGPPQWLQVDLGSIKNINEVKLLWGIAHASAYQIQTSNDGITWTTIYITTAGPGGTEDLTGLNVSGRYVRMYATAFAGPTITLNELEVFGSATSSDLTIKQIYEGKDPFTVGQKVTYVLTVANTNVAQSAINPISVTDELPSGLKDIQAYGIGWSITSTPWGIFSTTKSSPMLITAQYLSPFPLAAGTCLPSIIISGTLTGAAVPGFLNTAIVSTLNDINTSNNKSLNFIEVNKEHHQENGSSHTHHQKHRSY